jgi:excisionase family DNA binding protein
MQTTKLLLSKRDCAAALSVSVRTVENLIARKELVARRIGSRTLIPVASLEAFTKRDHATRAATQEASVSS